MKRYIHTLIISLLLAPYAVAQNSEVLFNHFPTISSMTERTINSIYQDSLGFMWFATNRGLVRFDGSNVKEYNRQNVDAQKGLLNSNRIYSIKGGADGCMWLRTGDGIVIFHPEAETFLPLELKWKGQQLSGISYQQFDANGHALLKTANGVFEYDTKNQKLICLNTTLEDEPEVEVSAVCYDRYNNIWLGYPNRGIYRYDKARQTVSMVCPNPHVPIIIGDYSADSLIFGTINKGVFIMSKRTGGSRKLSIPDNVNDNIFPTGFCTVSDHEAWISSESGIYILCNGQVADHLQHSNNDLFSLSSNKVSSIWRDRQGGIWAGTRTAGINYYSPNANKIRLYYPCNRFPGFQGSHITSLVEDNEGNVWVGSEDEGLFCMVANGTTQHFTTATLPQLRANHITSLLMKNDELWVGTYTGGLSVLDTRSAQWRHYEKTKDDGSLKNNEENCLLVDDEGRLWIGTTTHLFLYNDERRDFRLIDGIEAWINDVVDDHAGNLWIATAQHGLLCYRKSDGRVTSFTHQPHSSSSLCFGGLSCLFVDEKGQLWIGSDEDGLCVLDNKRQQFSRIGKDEGLTGGEVCKIMADDEGCVWVSTAEGLSKLDVETFRVIQTLDNNQGLLGGRQFYSRSGMKTRNGELYWGCTNGYIAFHSEDIRQQQQTNPPVATEVKYSQENGGTLQQGDGAVCLTLPYNEAAFRTQLSARDYEHGNTGVFQYRLEGYDNEWQTCDRRTVVTYNNLPPGSYLLYARYSAEGLTWSEAKTVIRVKVLPPWWGTWWALVLYLLLVAASCVFAIRYMKKNKAKAIAQQRKEWEKQQEEESMEARINFFTNIAHEIRTPVSLIKLSVEQMEDEGVKTKGMEVLNRNTTRLTELVNELLEFRRWEVSTSPLHPVELDVCHLLKLTTDNFAPTIEKKGIAVGLHGVDCTHTVLTDEKALTIILTNLVGNATKYCRQTIDVSVKERDGNVVMHFSNDGPSIPAEIREHLFEPFVKSESEHNSTGLGLALVKLLAEKIGAQISYSSTDATTCFTLSIPVTTRGKQTSSSNSPVVSDEVIPQATAETDSATPTIMIVEDNDDLRTFLSERLSDKYRVLTATDGQEGWKLLQEQEADVVVSDVMMPRMDGFELCGRIKSHIATCHVPVVLLTARTTEPDHIKGFKTGADAYMDKPFSVRQLQAQLESLLLNRQLQRRRWLNQETQTDTTQEESVKSEMFTSPIDQQFYQKLTDYINSHMSDEDFNIDLLAQHMNMSRSNFHRKMKALFGTTPGDYVFMNRMRRAAQLLAEGRLRVGEVASEVGFQSVSHFSRAFLKQYGVQPSNYGKQP